MPGGLVLQRGDAALLRVHPWPPLPGRLLRPPELETDAASGESGSTATIENVYRCIVERVQKSTRLTTMP